MPAYVKCKSLTKHFPYDGNSAETNAEEKRQFQNGKLVALSGLDLDLKEGDVLGVIGLNGAGKSTLLKILSGVLKPTSGTAEISGTVTSILEQSSIFSSELTGIENLVFYGNLLGYKTKHIKSKIPDILKFADLELFGETQLKNYSSGMKLRLAFGLMKELSSDILILDEALSAGDQIFQEKIANTLDDYLTESSIVLMATHDFQEITRYCNKCLLLEYGNPVFYGDVQEAVSIFYAQNRGKSSEKKEDAKIEFKGCDLSVSNEQLTINDTIKFWFEYEVLEDGLPLDLLMTLAGSSPVLIDSPMLRNGHKTKILNKGIYKQEIEIPANVLNVGSYRVSILFGDGDDVTYLNQENALSVDIHSDGGTINNKLSKAANIYPIRVPLKWS